MGEYILQYLRTFPTFGRLYRAKHFLRNMTSAIQRTPTQRKTKTDKSEDIWRLYN